MAALTCNHHQNPCTTLVPHLFGKLMAILMFPFCGSSVQTLKGPKSTDNETPTQLEPQEVAILYSIVRPFALPPRGTPQRACWWHHLPFPGIWWSSCMIPVGGPSPAVHPLSLPSSSQSKPHVLSTSSQISCQHFDSEFYYGFEANPWWPWNAVNLYLVQSDVYSYLFLFIPLHSINVFVGIELLDEATDILGQWSPSWSLQALPLL